MRTWTGAAVVAGVIAAPLQSWLMLGGDMREFVEFETPAGQLPYVLSKLSALYAVELVWLQAMLGLLRPVLLRRHWATGGGWRRLHTALGMTALAAMLAHVGLFVAAASLRNNVPALDLLLPWGHGVYRTWVAFGAASLWLLSIAIGVQVARLADAAVRIWVHRLTLVAIALVGVHSLAIGSESRSGAMLTAYVVMGSTLLAALAMRRSGSRSGHDQVLAGLAAGPR